jgi:hypothetical protein
MRLLRSVRKLLCRPTQRTTEPQTSPHRVTLFFAKQGNQGSRPTRREDHQAGKVRNGVRWKNLLRRYQSAACCKTRVFVLILRSLELAKGIEPPTL